MAKKTTKKKPRSKKKNNSGANLGFEAKLWAAADKMRGHMDPSEYKHVALGLIFLKYISDTFEEHRGKLVPQDPNDLPASILLARIKQEREAKAATVKMAKTKKKPTRRKDKM